MKWQNSWGTIIEEEGSICTHYTFNNCLSLIQSPELLSDKSIYCNLKIPHLSAAWPHRVKTFLFSYVSLQQTPLLRSLMRSYSLGLYCWELRPVVLKFEHASGSLEGLLKPWTAGPGINPWSVIDLIWSREFAGEVEVNWSGNHAQRTTALSKNILTWASFTGSAWFNWSEVWPEHWGPSLWLSVRITQNLSGADMVNLVVVIASSFWSKIIL